MDTGEILIIIGVVAVPAIILWLVYFMRVGRPGKPHVALGIPQAMRPASPDDKLEGPRLERILGMGFLATIALAVFIPVYWLPESTRQTHFQETFDEESVHRGQLIFSAPPELEEDADPARFKELESEISLGMNCAQCHGAVGELGGEDPALWASGGQVPFTDPVLGEEVRYMVPPLQDVFTRWDEEIVRFTIERGRPGTDMPAWGIDYGGPMTDQMVDDVIAFLKTLPGNQTAPEISEDCQEPDPTDVQCGEEIFAARCAVCHGPKGQGKESTTQIPATDEAGEPIEDAQGNPTTRKGLVYYSGLALWKGDVKHLTEDQHLFTVRNGRRFAFMPQFAEAPTEGIPVPPYPLTDDQIKAVVAYERTL